jgi:SAM-dependent methyltransferase
VQSDAPACPICSDSRPKPSYRLREMLFGTRETFDYRLCERCGVLWLEHPPADMSAYYPDDYYAPEEAAPGPSRPARGLRDRLGEQVAARRLFGGHRLGAALGRRFGAPVKPEVREVRDVVRSAGLRSFDDPILDVGSSPTPTRAATLVAAGFRDVTGIDPWLRHEGDYHGVRLRRMSTTDLPATARGSYGLITFHHSFEHVPDPRSELVTAGGLLRPGGAIVIRTPVMGTWFWETFGTSWWELDAPRHLFVLSRASLELLGRDAGLTLETVGFESSPVEIIASRQIADDIPWRDPRSWGSRPPSPEKSAVLQASAAQVAQLNAEGRGGRAIFLFRRPTRAEDSALASR